MKSNFDSMKTTVGFARYERGIWQPAQSFILAGSFLCQLQILMYQKEMNG